MSIPSTINDTVVQDSTSRTPRETQYANCFKINGVAMPIPSSWQVDPKILTRDAKRKIKSGALRAPYVATCYTITWTYKYLKMHEYNILRQAYIDHCTSDKSVKFCVATMDSNRQDSVFCTMAYTEDGFTAPIYRIDPITNEHYYKDVKFTIVSVGGLDFKTNYFVTRQNFQTSGDSTFNQSNYVERIGDIRKKGTSSDYYGIGYTNT